MNEKVITINGIPIKYLYKERKYDTKHLVVVFSGFGAQSEFTYDFKHAFQNIHANVLWIKDDFFGHCSYYLGSQNNLIIEDSIIQFIYQMMDQNDLSKKEVTILGASKGGSAALYYGIKYQFLNILISVPQLLIGDYVTSVWPRIGEHMLNHINTKDYFDALILEQIKKDKYLDRNIYLLTSEVDIQYKKHIAPYLKYFYKYSNFNALFSESVLVREHNQITAHHTDIIMGIVSLLSANVAPTLGHKALYGDLSITKAELPYPIIELKKIYLENNRLYLDGIGIVRGKEAKDYQQISYKLILVGENGELEINIAKAHRPYLTRQYYNGNLCIYDKCWFTTYKYEGVDLLSIPIGSYQIYLEIIFQDYSIREALKYKGIMSNSTQAKLSLKDENLYLIRH